MGVAVLSPENCLRDGFPHQNRHLMSAPRSKPRRSSATNRSGRRKPQWTPDGSPPPHSKTNSPSDSGQFRILKRGEELTPTKHSISTITPVKNRKTKKECSPDLMSLLPGPAPGSSPLLGGFYAGSAFFTSPPPSSVPLPAFCTKNIGAGAGVLTKSSAEDATFDLRRILRLE